MIVAGHGYSDPGAVGNGTNERDFIRKNIVDSVANYLKDAGHTVTVYGKNKICIKIQLMVNVWVTTKIMAYIGLSHRVMTP